MRTFGKAKVTPAANGVHSFLDEPLHEFALIIDDEIGFFMSTFFSQSPQHVP